MNTHTHTHTHTQVEKMPDRVLEKVDLKLKVTYII